MLFVGFVGMTPGWRFVFDKRREKFEGARTTSSKRWRFLHLCGKGDDINDHQVLNQVQRMSSCRLISGVPSYLQPQSNSEKQHNQNNQAMPKKQQKYYAVKKGTKPGVYDTWDECSKQVSGYKGAVYKAFPSLEEAQAFVSGKPFQSGASNSGSNRDSPKKPYDRSSAVASSSSSSAKGGNANTNANSLYKIPALDHSQYPLLTAQTVKIVSAQAFKPFNNDCTVKSDLKLSQRREKQARHQAVDALQKFKYDTIVYTDGSCLGNGKKKGRVVGGIGAYFGPNDARNVSEPFTDENPTNQRAEIKAALIVLQRCVSNEEHVRIFTDSQYLINSACEWRWKWEMNAWMSSSGDDVANMDLFMPLFNLIDSRSGGVRWEYVPGHKGIPGNEAADQLAVQGSNKTPQ